MNSTNNPKSVLITGATGFVGINLVHALLEKNYKVVCLVRSTSSLQFLAKLPVQLLQGDLHNLEAIRSLATPLHTVYHLAGAVKAADRSSFFNINQAGTCKLLAMLAETHPELHRFIHVSSLAASGPSIDGRPRTEEETAAPVSWYGESKLAAEKDVLRFQKTFPVTIVRPSAVYGPYDTEILLIFRMIKHGCMITPGRHTRRFSLIHVADLVQALIQAAESSVPTGRIYNLSRPEIYLWEDVGRAIAGELGITFRRISLPAWIAQGAGFAGDCWTKITKRPATINSQKVGELLAPSWLCDSSKAREQLGFNPDFDLERGVRTTIRWYKIHGWL